MAFIASQAIRNSISRPTNQVVCDMSDKGSMDRFSFKNKGIYKGQRNLQDHLTVANVASPLPVIAPPPEERSGTTGGRRHHVAWTSIPQERWEGELLVQGQIPLWLKGTYLRNGPGMWHIGDYNFRHLFDGYATLVKLHIENGRLIAGHRQIESQAYQAAKKNRKICYREFSEVPKAENFLAYMGELASLFSGASLTDNANTGVVRLGDGRVVCLTETQKGSIVIDPDTLDTLGKFEYSDSLWGLIHSAHPIVTDKEFLTLLPDLVKPGYLVVRMEPGSNERRVIGRVDCRGGPSPGWVHSFPVTEHYVIVPEMPLRYCAQNLLKAEPTPLYKFQWHPESNAFMHVMCKTSGNIVASVEVPLFVTFHFINAYEEEDEDGRVTAVIADCCEHNSNTSILDKLRLQNLRSYNGQDVLPDARVGRFRIPLDGSPYGTLEAALDPIKLKKQSSQGAVMERPSVTAVEVENIAFPPTVKPPGSSDTFFLGGAGERGLQIQDKFVKFTAIGVYLQDNAVPFLSAKWKGKPAHELTESVPFFRDIVTGPFEKFMRVTMILPLTGQQYSEKVSENCVAIWKSLGIYTDEEAKAIEKFVSVFKDETFPPGSSILFTVSPKGSLTVSFSKDGSIPEVGSAVIENKLLSEAVLESMIGKDGVSPAAKQSLASRLSGLFKEGGDTASN